MKPGRNIIVVFLIITGIPGERVSAQLAPAILNWDGSLGSLPALPLHLSESGFDPANTAVFVPYDINVPQWRNFMSAQRYVSVPAGTSIVPGDTLNYQFPPGTAFIRVCYLDTVFGNPATRKNIEVQMQIRSADEKWHRLVYVYKDGITDPILLNGQNGLVIQNLSVNISGKGLPYYQGGTGIPKDTVMYRHLRLPTDCSISECHVEFSTNGFYTQQLNKGNQFQTLVNSGVLAGLPDLAGMAARGIITEWADKRDTSASLRKRVLSYLGGNCGVCHHAQTQSSSLTGYLQYFHEPAAPNPDFGSAGVNFIPGLPGASPVNTMMHDLTMPSGSEVDLPDGFALNMLWEWTNSLDGDPSNDQSYLQYVDVKQPPAENPSANFSLSYRSGLLRLTGTFTQKAGAALYTLKGKPIAMRKLSVGTYFVPNKLAPGVYFVKIKKEVSLLTVH